MTAASSGNNSVVMLDSAHFSNNTANKSAVNVTNNMVTNNIVINNPPTPGNDYGKSTACTSNYYDYGGN